MTGTDLRAGREQRGWTQEQAAIKLGVSQPYLSLLEKGMRRVPDRLARRAATLYRLSAAKLPVETGWHSVQAEDNNALASALAGLGYPGLSYLKARRKRNPAEVMLSALKFENLDTRLAEALPWVLLKHPDLNWEWLVRAAKVNDLQNKLGFVTSVARRLAEKLGKHETVSLLGEQESTLERSRLAREDTLCHDSLTQSERRWLQSNRSDEAKHWNLLTDLTPENLSHAL
ncbi:MAG TPA: helix-turn-helix transcriptional regulator [Pyrinomonadaceae bacterium]